MQLEHLHEQRRGRVQLEVVRQVADPDPSVGPRRPLGRRQRPHAAEVTLRVLGEHASLHRRVGTERQEHERTEVVRPGLPELLAKRRQVLVEPCPVARVQAVVDDAAEPLTPARPQRERGPQALDRLHVKAEPVERVAQHDVGLEAVGLARQRLEHRGGGLAVPSDAIERDAVLEPRRVVGARRARDPLGVVDRVGEAVPLDPRRHAQLAGDRVVRVELERAVGGRERALQVAELAAGLAEVHPVQRLGRQRAHRAGVRLLRLLPAAGARVVDADAPVALGVAGGGRDGGAGGGLHAVHRCGGVR